MSQEAIFWISVTAPIFTSVAGFFLARALARADSANGDIARIREDLVRLKMSDEAQWRYIDDHKAQLKGLDATVLEIQLGTRE